MVDQELFQYLVDKLAASTPARILQATTDKVDEVLLESQINGISYYLVRCRPKQQSSIHLSPREQAVAKLVAQGLPNKSIGEQLNISTWTVATYLRRIFAKLEVTSRAAMIAKLSQANLL